MDIKAYVMVAGELWDHTKGEQETIHDIFYQRSFETQESPQFSLRAWGKITWACFYTLVDRLGIFQCLCRNVGLGCLLSSYHQAGASANLRVNAIYRVSSARLSNAICLGSILGATIRTRKPRRLFRFYDCLRGLRLSLVIVLQLWRHSCKLRPIWPPQLKSTTK